MEKLLALSIHYLGYDLCLSPSLKINKCNNVPGITILKLITKEILINEQTNLILYICFKKEMFQIIS